MVSERVVCRDFVGRVDELEHLRARRRAAAEGRGGLVLVAGEAGIGKSRLVDEFCSHLTPGRHRIANAVCREFAQRPFGPLADLLREADGSSPFQERAATREDQLAAVLAAFDRATEHLTAVFVLEDLHWADAGLIATLELLSERARTRRVLIVATYRDDQIAAAHSIFIPLGRLLRREGVSLLKLNPFDQRDGERLLNGALGGGMQLAPPMVRDLLRRSDGNPLFTEELLRHVIDRARAGGGTSLRALPLTVRAVVSERLNRCTERQRELLAQAAVVGRRFRADLLAEAFDAPLATLIAPLQQLCELQLLDVRDGESHGFQFRHALTRDAVYAEMLPAQTRPLHLRIARALANRPDAVTFAEIVAHNFWEAGEYEAAAPFCERAGEEARAVFAYDEVAHWYERAAQGHTANPAEVGRLLGKSADALLQTDVIDRLVTVREEAAAAFLKAGNLERAVELRNYILGTLGNDGRTDAARACGEATLALIPAELPRLRDLTAIRLASLEAAVRSTERAWRHIESVDEPALDGSSALALEYYAVRSSVHAQRGEVTAWRACYARSLEVCEASKPNIYLQRWLPGSIAVQALALGDLETAREQQARSLAIARERRLDLTYALAVTAQIELRAGNVALARELVEQARPTHEMLPRAERMLAAIGVAVALGDRERLAALLDPKIVSAAESGGNHHAQIEANCALALALASLGRAREAQPLLERAAAAITHPFGLSEAIVTIVRLEPHLAKPLRAVLAAHAAAAEDRVNRALLAYVDAALARAPEERRERGRDAGAQFAALGWPLYAARALEVAGCAAEALEVYRRCGAEGEVRRLDRASYSRERAAGSILNEREHAVAELVAAGKGNRATAATLAISEKTVEKSLTAIYAKLGLSSRTELAAYMVRAANAATSPSVTAGESSA